MSKAEDFKEKAKKALAGKEKKEAKLIKEEVKSFLDQCEKKLDDGVMEVMLLAADDPIIFNRLNSQTALDMFKEDGFLIRQEAGLLVVSWNLPDAEPAPEPVPQPEPTPEPTPIPEVPNAEPVPGEGEQPIEEPVLEPVDEPIPDVTEPEQPVPSEEPTDVITQPTEEPEFEQPTPNSIPPELPGNGEEPVFPEPVEGPVTGEPEPVDIGDGIGLIDNGDGTGTLVDIESGEELAPEDLEDVDVEELPLPAEMKLTNAKLNKKSKKKK